MNIFLWVLQGLLGLAYTLGGLLKILAQKKLGLKQAWIRDEKPGLLRFIGASEVLGGLGLVLPGLTRVFPVLTAVAALGLVMIMLMAAGYRLGRKEGKEFGIDLGFAAVLGFIAVGRFAVSPL